VECDLAPDFGERAPSAEVFFEIIEGSGTVGVELSDVFTYTGPDTPSAASSWSGTQVLYSVTKHAVRRSADEIGATSISFRPKVFSDPASAVD
jgi:hypothetical protein